jgi:hypothetical protein
MGMEVTAYAEVQLVPHGNREHAAFVVDEEAISRWPLSSVGLTPGMYQSTGAEFDVRVGHLMSYMWWREQLSQLGGYRQQDVLAGDVNSGPFVELISFADLQGVIGNAAARKLADDFELFDPQAQALGSSFYGLYVQFKRVFEFAKDAGVVSIH